MRTMKNAMANLVQTAILNFKMATKNRVFRLTSVSETKRLDFGLYAHILRVKELNENNNICIS